MNILDKYLSLHFRLSEFVHSQTADRFGINNTPFSEIIERLRANAGLMEDECFELGENRIDQSGSI